MAADARDDASNSGQGASSDEVSEAEPEQVSQFEREGYFVADRYDHTSENPVFNMTIGLRDTWSASNA